MKKSGQKRFLFNLWRKMCAVVLCILTMVMEVPAAAATPRVMLSDYSIKEGTVTAGKEFTLYLTMENTAQKTVKNIKVSLVTEAGELLPVDGAGTAYIEQIDSQSGENLTFKMKAADGLEEKSYKLTVKTEYENTGGYEYMVEDAIYIPISLEQRLSVTDVFTGEEGIEVGDMAEIGAVVNNLGAGKLYNVSARVEGDNVQETNTYVGSIEPGKSGTVDVLTKADVVTEGDHKDNRMIISYEDKEGNVSEKEIEIMVEVAKPVYENLEKIKETADYSGLVKTAVTGIVVVLATALLIWIFIKRRKRKQQILDEFMD